jgi:exonuclease III
MPTAHSAKATSFAPADHTTTTNANGNATTTAVHHQPTPRTRVRPDGTTATNRNTKPRRGGKDTTIINIPCLLDYSGVTWNTQALMTQNPGKQTAKLNKVKKLALKHDMIGLQEVHGTDGREVSFNGIDTHKQLWSHGSRSQAGIGLWMRKTFLEKFNDITEHSWDEIEPGRVGRLRLQGPNGNLDIFVVYLQAGSNIENRADRLASMKLISNHIAPKEHTLSVMMGDWNFAHNPEDRWCFENKAWTGAADKPDANHFNNLIAKKHGMHEWLQPTLTHRCKTSISKLDRIYTNHSIYDQLDRAYGCTTLPETTLSSHRPVTFSRRTPNHDGEIRKSPSLLRHPPRHLRRQGRR